MATTSLWLSCAVLRNQLSCPALRSQLIFLIVLPPTLCKSVFLFQAMLQWFYSMCYQSQAE